MAIDANNLVHGFEYNALTELYLPECILFNAIWQGVTMATKRKPPKETQPGGVEASPRLDILKKLRVVIRAAQRHSIWIEKQCGVSGAQLWMMQELHDHPGLRVGELANKLAIHQTTASNLLDALRKRGYVVKARDLEDQRVVNLKLSEEGEKALLKAPIPARGLLPEAILNLDDESLQQLDKGLQGLLNSIDKLDEGFAMLPLSFNM